MFGRSRQNWDPEAMRQAIEAHDQDAFNQAFDPFAARVKDPLCGYLYKTFDPLSWEECKDFTQEAIVTTWLNAFKGKVKDLSKLKSYCYSTARQQVIKYLDRSKDRPQTEVDETTQSSEDESTETEWFPRYRQEHWPDVDRCMAFLKKLGEKCQKILLLDSQGATMAYIAQVLDYASPDTAKTSKYRCRKKLMEQLRDDKDD